MQTIQIAKRQINYKHTLHLTYKIKITKTTYTNKQNQKTYTRYKIRIPDNLQQQIQHHRLLPTNNTKTNNTTKHKRRIPTTTNTNNTNNKQ